MDWIFGLVLMLIGQVGVLCMCDKDLVRSWNDWVIDWGAGLGLVAYGFGLLVFLGKI